MGEDGGETWKYICISLLLSTLIGLPARKLTHWWAYLLILKKYQK